MLLRPRNEILLNKIRERLVFGGRLRRVEEFVAERLGELLCFLLGVVRGRDSRQTLAQTA